MGNNLLSLHNVCLDIPTDSVFEAEQDPSALTTVIDYYLLQDHVIPPSLKSEASCHFPETTAYYKQVWEMASCSVPPMPEWCTTLASSPTLLSQASYEWAFRSLLLEHACYLCAKD